MISPCCLYTSHTFNFWTNWLIFMTSGMNIIALEPLTLYQKCHCITKGPLTSFVGHPSCPLGSWMLGNVPQHCLPQLQTHVPHLACGSLNCLRWSNSGICSKRNKLLIKVIRLKVFLVALIRKGTGLIGWWDYSCLNYTALFRTVNTKAIKIKI